MNEALIRNWNSVVKPIDIVHHLGDFAFCNEEKYNKLLNRLNGTIHLILGNHDKLTGEIPFRFASVQDYKILKYEGRRIVLFHYAMRVWKRHQAGYYHAFGHCIDLETEILTKTGWKSRKTISVGDELFTYNHDTKILEKDFVKEIIDVDYSGRVFEYAVPMLNMRVTSNHTIPRFSMKGKLKHDESAENFFNRTDGCVIRAWEKNQTESLDISDDHLRLYIFIAADGQIKQSTNLVRIVIKKQRKIEYVKTLLTRLGIEFKIYFCKDTSTSFNFYLPNCLKFLNIKGLDSQLLRCNKKQVSIILEAYSFSDGRKVADTTIIYSSKEEEIDLLQNLAIINGFGATKSGRLHGFGGKNGKMSYQLCISPANLMRLTYIKNRVVTTETKNEPFWCIKTNNENFFMRRKGKVHLTGNSHGTTPSYYRSLDVGVDCHNFTPLHLHDFFRLADESYLKWIGKNGNITHDDLD